ncbi:MAG: hypothetical protein H0W12_10170 [Chitinophagaceae bacterium]|nr:hypothetical protein [Chitinophagaceae bacterium]
MKLSLFLTFICSFILTVKGFSQSPPDSVRTRNDKPGTPQSLRTPNQAPTSHVQLINTNIAVGQTINHGATESNKLNNNTEKTIIVAPRTKNGKAIPKTPITLVNKPLIRADSVLNAGAVKNGISNSTNPIRK